MPRLDPLMEEGRIVEWRKKEGDRVEAGEVIVVVEGEKTTFEVEARSSGVVKAILRKEGEVARVGEPIAVIEEAGEEKPAEVKASPMARRLAQQYGIKLEEVKGTGPGGRITKEDVLRVVQERRLEKPTVEEEKARRVPFAGIRKAITERLYPGFHEALPVALMTEFNAQELMQHRERSGNPSFTAYAVKAVAIALSENPEMNVTLEGDEMVYHEETNIAVAVDTPKGLMAPVIRDAKKKNLLEITREIDEFQRKGERGDITLEDMKNHSFTVTNLGALGVEFFTPIINPPDIAILAIGAVKQKPVVRDGKIEAGIVGYLTLVFDHRVVDGAKASKLLARIKQLLENPQELEK